MSRHVQDVGMGVWVWVAGVGTEEEGEGEEEEKKEGEGGVEGKARLPSWRDCSLVGEAKELHDS